MINKLLIEIKEKLDKIDKIFNDTDYFQNLEQYMEKVQEENKRLRNEIELLKEKSGE